MSVYLRLLLTHLPAFLIGLALVDLLWPTRGPRDFALKLSLGCGLGWGVSSALFFLWSLAFSPFARVYNGLEWLLALGLLGLDLFLSRTAWSELMRRLAVIPRPHWAALAALLVFLLGALLVWLRADAQPNGNFDAYAIWNMRARFLFLSSDQTWRSAFSPNLSWWVHADYPLLWPLTLLRAYLAQGRVLTQAGVLQAAVFGWASLGLMIGGLYKLRPGWQASLGGLALLSMPWFINFSAFQQADVPLAYFYLAVVLLLALALRSPQAERPGLLALAGLALGCAVWTKNDGIALLLAAGGLGGLALLRGKGGLRWRVLAAVGLGLLLPLAAVMAFKVVLAPPGDLIGAQSAGEVLAKLAMPQRYELILRAILALLPSLGGLPWPALAGGLGYGLLAGRSPGQQGGRLFGLLLLALLGYFAVYLVTPQPQEWHLGYSLDRLLFHLLLPALFLCLAVMRSPEELLERVALKVPA